MECVARKEYRLERRFTMASRVVRASGGEETGEIAVNDVVVHKTGSARIVRLRVCVDLEEVGIYTADGMIVASPAGSTAYSLSAGGPVLLPDVDAFVITPICPHTLRVRPVVVSANAEVALEVVRDRASEVMVSYDGQPGAQLDAGDRVHVRRADRIVDLVRLEHDGFFTWMRQKLEWGDLRDRERLERVD